MKYAVLAVMMVLMAGILHMLFISYDYAFNNPDSGAFTILRERANESMTAEYREKAYNNSQMLKQMFGICRFIVLALAVVLFIVEAVTRPRMQE